MKKNKRTSFKQIKQEYIHEISAEATAYTHPSGATCITLACEDTNKVFCITFRTQPKSDKGEAHITEHCVLCGSRKYNLKDPFHELEKGSLKTYLNAITFEDKTMYPVASTNEDELRKMMDVYLDGVFFPSLYQKEEIFLQEGHYNGEDGTNGIVYNEMKGAFASTERQLHYALKKQLFPDVDAQYDAGGTPDAIPTLTYEQLLAFHKIHYHPSNCILYLYGDMDMEAQLDYIDTHFLQPFGTCPETESKFITRQEPFEHPKEIKVNYSAPAVETQTRPSFAAGFALPSVLDEKQKLQLEVLTHMLFNTQSSPLKNGLLKKGMGTNVYGYFDAASCQPRICIVAEQSTCEDVHLFRRSVEEILAHIEEEGIAETLRDAVVNHFEFKYREENYGYKPRGLAYGIDVIDTFLYGNHTFAPLKKISMLQEIKDTNFEALMEQSLLKNNHAVYLMLEADVEKPTSVPITQASPVDNSQQQRVGVYQQTADKQEELEKIHIIDRQQIKNETPYINLQQDCLAQVNRYLLEEKTNAIAYFSYMFDTTKVQSACHIGLLNYLLGKLNTATRKWQMVSEQINQYMGGFSIHFQAFRSLTTEAYEPVVTIGIKCFDRYIKESHDILTNVIVGTRFDDKDRIQRLLLELKAKMEKQIISSGSRVAVNRSLSYFNQAYEHAGLIGGIDFYCFLKDLLQHFDAEWENLSAILQQTKDALFTKNNVEMATTITSYTKEVETMQRHFIDALPDKNPCQAHLYLPTHEKNEGIIIKSGVQSNALSGNYKKNGLVYTGHLQVVNQVLASELIWNKLRLEGGAYGGGTKFTRDGLLYFYSERDPNIEKTYTAYREIHHGIKNLCLTERQLKQYKIGAINKIDRPLRAKEKGVVALYRHKAGITREMVQKEREEIVDTTCHHIQAASECIETVVASNNICTLGNQKQILDHKHFFRTTLTL